MKSLTALGKKILQIACKYFNIWTIVPSLVLTTKAKNEIMFPQNYGKKFNKKHLYFPC